MKWTILFLMLCGIGAVFFAEQMPFAIGDDPRRLSGFAESIADSHGGAEDVDGERGEHFAGEAESILEAGDGLDEDEFEEPGAGGEEEEEEERLTEVVRLKTLEAKRALEVLKRIGDQRHLSMGVDEETNVLILSGHRENVELATKILRALENGRPDEARRFLTDADDGEDRENGPGSTTPVDESVDFDADALDLLKGSDKDFDFWNGFPRDEDVEELLARRMEELEEVDHQAGEIQAGFAQAIARSRSNRNDRDAERAQRHMQQRLSEAVTKAFELRQQVQRLQVDRLRSRLANVTEKMNQREQLRKRIISQRLNQMTQEAETAAMEHLEAVRGALPDGAARPIDFSKMEPAGKSAPLEDTLTRATVRITWNFTEDFGRRVSQIHTSGTICGKSPGGSTLVVTLSPKLPDEEPSSITVSWPGMNPFPAQVASIDEEQRMMLLSTGLIDRHELPIATAPKTGLAIRASWVTDEGWADSAGVVVAVGRQIGKRQLIQHDIAAAGVAAGGPIVNRKGRLIGLMASLRPGQGVNMAVPAADVQRFVDSAFEQTETGFGLLPNERELVATGNSELPIDVLEIRREMIDAKHVMIAAEKDHTRMTQLNRSSANIVSSNEVERTQLKYERARDMLAATKRIFDARVRLLEQKMRLTQTALEKKQSEFREASRRLEDDPKEVVLEAYVGDLKEELLLLQAVQERQQTLYESLDGSDEDEGTGEETRASDEIPPGMVAVSIPIDDSLDSIGLLSAGDRVDVLVTYATKGRTGSSRQVRTVVEFARVFAVDTRREVSVNKERTARVSLLLRPDDARLLKLAEDVGQLHVAVRSAHDTDPDRAKQSELFQPDKIAGEDEASLNETEEKHAEPGASEDGGGESGPDEGSSRGNDDAEIGDEKEVGE